MKKMLLLFIALTFSIPAFADQINQLAFHSGLQEKSLISLEEKSTQAQDYFRLFLTNQCNETVRMFVVSTKLDGNWDTEAGYYELRPGQTGYIANTRNVVYYVAGASVSGRFTWSGNTKVTLDDGTQVGMIERRIGLSNWGDWEQKLICN